MLKWRCGITGIMMIIKTCPQLADFRSLLCPHKSVHTIFCTYCICFRFIRTRLIFFSIKKSGLLVSFVSVFFCSCSYILIHAENIMFYFKLLQWESFSHFYTSFCCQLFFFFHFLDNGENDKL